MAWIARNTINQITLETLFCSKRPRTTIHTCDDHDDEHCEPKRFDPGDFDSEYKLDNSK